MENYPYNTSSYPESGDSSPRSREIDFDNPPPWEDQHQHQPPNYKVKFMCSYGGKIHPRPHDNLLSYIGGETKILSVDRTIRFTSLLSKLISLCDGESVSFKYQLPGEDLDALISVTNDDDLEHMMHEYDRLYRISPKPARLRIFVFPSLNSSLSNRSFGSEEGKSDKERFVEALNSAPIVTPPPPETAAVAVAKSNVDFLFGLEKANAVINHPAPVVVGRVPVVEDPVVVPDPVLDERFVASDPIQKHIQDLQRLRLEEQATNYRRKSNDYVAGGSAGGGGEYYKEQERSSPVAVTGGVPYWTEKQVPGGVLTTNSVNNEQPIYMIPPQAGAYHAPMMRQVTGPPSQGYYAVQRIPSDPYRDQQQQQMYNVIPPSMAAAPPSLPPQKVAGYTSEGFGMVRPVVTDPGYAQMAYDGGMGRQVIYTAPGGVMGTPAPVQTAAAAAHYQAMVAAGGVDMRQGGGLNLDSGGKVIARPTQTQTSV